MAFVLQRETNHIFHFINRNTKKKKNCWGSLHILRCFSRGPTNASFVANGANGCKNNLNFEFHFDMEMENIWYCVC